MVVVLMFGGRIYIVATNDKDLKRRIRKIPGVPIMTCGTGKYVHLVLWLIWVF